MEDLSSETGDHTVTENNHDPFDVIGGLARRAETLATLWINGAPYRQVKDEAWKIGREVRLLPIVGEGKKRDSLIGAAKAVRLVSEALRCASFSNNAERTILKKIVSDSIALMQVCIPAPVEATP